MTDGALELASRVWANECELWLALGHAAGPSGIFRVEQAGDLICAWWQGNDVVMENDLFVHPTFQGDPASLFASIQARVEASSSPTSVRCLAQGDPTAWVAAAERYGYTYTLNRDPLLAAPTDQEFAPIAFDHAVTIEETSDHSQYRAALDIIRESFGGPPGLTEFFQPAGVFQRFVAYYDGAPVAAAKLALLAGVAGVYSVSTRRDFRGRGLATAVMNHLLGVSRRAGYTLATLRTVDDLLPLYARSGFRIVGRAHAFWYQPR